VVQLLVSPPAAAIHALRSEPEVASVTQLGNQIHVLLRPEAPRDLEACALLAERLAAAGLRCEAAEPAEPDLEDVFVSLVGPEGRGADPRLEEVLP
jgi:hypothetical protein